MIYVDVKEDRRGFPRLGLKDSALLMTNKVMGLIRDISLGGLAFSYCHKGALPAAGSSALEIIVAHDIFTMEAGQFEIVDNRAVSDNTADWSILVARLKFCNLDSGKFTKLWHFIKHNCMFDIHEAYDAAGNGMILQYSALPTVTADFGGSLIGDRA